MSVLKWWIADSIICYNKAMVVCITFLIPLLSSPWLLLKSLNTRSFSILSCLWHSLLYFRLYNHLYILLVMQKNLFLATLDTGITAKQCTTSHTHIVSRSLCPSITSSGFYSRCRAGSMLNLVSATALSIQMKWYLPGTVLSTYLEMSAFLPVSFQRFLSCSFVPSLTFCFHMCCSAVCFLITIKVAFLICVCKKLQKFVWKKINLANLWLKSFWHD